MASKKNARRSNDRDSRSSRRNERQVGKNRPALAQAVRSRKKSDTGTKSATRDKPTVEVADEPVTVDSQRLWIIGFLTACGLLSYAPSIYLLAEEWDRLQDYSHGYLVIPFALVLAWLRRGSMPPLKSTLSWPGMVLVAISVGVRWFAAAYFVDFVDGISIIFWAAGIAWLVGGGRFLLWALPSIGFLLFMVPLPYSVNQVVRMPLQRVATTISTYILQLFGQPALAEGNTIIIEEHTLEVAQACSGLRIFVGILALAYFIVFMTPRTKLINGLIIASVLPIALVANAIRIVSTGLLMEYASTETAEKFSHDLAGWLMIPLACAMFIGFLWYLTKLFPRVEMIGLDSAANRA